MDITIERIAEIQKIAQEKVENYKLTLPVDPSLLASKLGMNVYEGELKDKEVRGAIKKTENSYNIFVDKNNSIVEKRDIIAHELGHYFLEHLKNKKVMFKSYKDHYKTSDLLEEESNRFSRCLLVPTNFLESTFELLSSLKCEVNEIVSELALIFKVSEKMIRDRLSDLELIKEG